MIWIARLALALLFICPIAVTSPATATEQDDAKLATDEIMSLFATRQYAAIWDRNTSKWFQQQTTRDGFLSTMAIGRQPFGDLSSSRFVASEFAVRDPATGVTGHIYSNTYLNKYTYGAFYEKLVVMKEDDGKFRLYGIWGSPSQ